MGCEQIREALSARLDGEDLPGEAAATDAHLSTCAACRQWLDDAAAVTRLARIGVAPAPSAEMPDFVPDVLPHARPRPRRERLATALRLLLGVLGGVQVLLALAQVAMPAMAGMTMNGRAEGAGPDHLLHEAAAWNLAVGAAFLFIAARRTRPGAILPLLTAFVATLSLLSIDDVLAGSVAWSRLASHTLLVVGYALVVVLSRPRLRPNDPSGITRAGRWRIRPAGGSVVDLPPGRLHGQPTAHTGNRAA